jgi:hypothetical protein
MTSKAKPIVLWAAILGLPLVLAACHPYYGHGYYGGGHGYYGGGHGYYGGHGYRGGHGHGGHGHGGHKYRRGY